MISKEELEKWAFQLNMDGDCDATDKDIETLITQALDTMEELETAKRCLPVDKEFEVRGSWIGSVQNYIVHFQLIHNFSFVMTITAYYMTSI
jgi:hypothetical protein